MRSEISKGSFRGMLKGIVALSLEEFTMSSNSPFAMSAIKKNKLVSLVEK